MKHPEQQTEMTDQKGRVVNFYPEGYWLIETVAELETVFLQLLTERLDKDYYQPPFLPPEPFPYDLEVVKTWPKAVAIHAQNYIFDYEKMTLRYNGWITWMEEARQVVDDGDGHKAYEVMVKWTDVCGCDPTFTIINTEIVT